MTVLRAPDPDVKAVFDGYPQALQQPLAELRRIIFETADAIPSIGPLEESLAWNQPAYRPRRPNLGTTLRIGPMPHSETDYGLFVHCQTTLVDAFRNLYRDRLRFSGTRALVFTAGEIPPVAPLKHFIALALTYHRRKIEPAGETPRRVSRVARPRIPA